MPFIELQSVDSTNKYAMALVHESLARHGFTLFAHEQTDGKGQRGRTWNSEKGKNLTFSIIVNPQPLTIHQSFLLSACSAIAILDLLRKHEVHELTVKWPNDIYWRDKKAGGILIQNLVGEGQPTGKSAGIHSTWKWSVIGIGLNINQTIFPAELPNPISLRQITGKTYDLIPLAKELCTVLDGRLKQLLEGKAESIINLYNDSLYRKNQRVKFRKAGRVFEALVKAVNSSGELIIEHGIEESITFGEAEWLA